MKVFVVFPFAIFVILYNGVQSSGSDSGEITTCSEPLESYPGDCTKYYVCDHGRPVALPCPAGLHWNNVAKVCDWPASANCNPSKPPTKAPSGSSDKPSVKPEHKPPSKQPSVSPVIPSQRPSVVPSNKPGSDEFKVVCYYTNWAFYRPGSGKYVPENIDGDLCTHIIYSFAVLDPNTLTIKTHDTWSDIDNKFYEKVTAFRQKGIKVLIALGGWNDSLGDKYGRLLLNESARKNFITDVIQFIQKHNFDGLDLDLEYPACWQNNCEPGRANEKAAFAQFAQELSDAFKPRGLLLSAAVAIGKNTIDAAYDVPKLAKSLDWISLMAYDLHGSWDGKTGHNAPLYSNDPSDVLTVDFATRYWIQKGAPSKKLVLGVPAYGRSFTLANAQNNGFNAQSTGAGEAGPLSREAGLLSYNEICSKAKEGWKVVRDPRIGPYAVNGNQWVSYDDVDDISRKTKFIRELNLGGGMIWALDQDDFTGECGCGKYPLLTALNQGLRNIGGSTVNNCT